MTAQEAITKIIALRRLTKETGVLTHKTQRHILQSLDEQTLAPVAVLLKQAGALEKDGVSRG